MGITVQAVATPRDRREFLHLPWRIYAGNRFWVPPLLGEMRRIVDPRRNAYLRKGPCRLFLAHRDGRPAGRIMAGADEQLNAARGHRDGWFSLFEAIDDYEAARALLDAARAYLASLGLNRMRGPVSPTGGDDYRGLLIDAFTSLPVLMESYNPPYYQEFMERYGLVKHEDLFAYYFYRRPPKNPRAVQYAQERYGFRLNALNLKDLEREIRDIKEVLERAIPAEWADMVPPSLDEVREMAAALKSFADPDLIVIARAGDEPIGFNVTLPDLNQVLIHLNGRLWPLGWLKFLYWRRRIDALRFFVLFVVPEWRKKGVSAAIFHRTFEAASAKGIIWGEGSTIGEENLPMRHDVERAGGRHYKTYRIYRGDL